VSQCWAFSQEGLRCDLIGGHEDAKHRHAIEWSDEDTFDPAQGTKVFAPEPRADMLVIPEPSVIDEARGPIHCFVCGHLWHEELCEQGGCGCRTAVA
jgi:hypothetical protein